MASESRTVSASALQDVLTEGLVDDAAVFPPGLAELGDAITWHHEHKNSPYAGMVGPLVLPGLSASHLGELVDQSGSEIAVCFTFPGGPGTIAEALASISPLVDIVGVEVAVPEDEVVEGLVSRIRQALGGRDSEIVVEIPRDARQAAVLAEVASAGARAKIRTGGIRQEMYPTGDELARTLRAIVAAGVSFKATAGLHHALRNTDPETGFEQHGFLNLLLATEAAVRGASDAELVDLLAERNADTISGRIQRLGSDGVERTRQVFTSFGSCSVNEPLTELVDLGLLDSLEGEQS